MWIGGLSVYDKNTGIDWKWQVDGRYDHKGTSWGKNCTGANQTYRTTTNSGTKRSIVVDGKDVPLGITVDVPPIGTI